MAATRASARGPAALRGSGTGARALGPGELAWLAAVPCALLTVAAIVVLGPPLGRAFLGPGSESFWPSAGIAPEPVEHGEFLVSLIGPPLLAGVVLAGSLRSLRAPARRIRAAVLIGQALVVALLAAALAAQYDVVFSAHVLDGDTTRYFTPTTLAVAAGVALLLAAAVRRPELVARAAAMRETRAPRIACLMAAGLLTAVWLLTVVDADSSIGTTIEAVSGHILWSMDETFAVLDGRTPMVDFHSQYAQLWPYPIAAAMAIFGTSIEVYTIAMALVTALTMLAIYAIFRRLVRSSPLALALFAPFLATSFFVKVGPLEDRFGPANLFSLWPARYGGAFLLAWLAVRHVDRIAPRRLWALFAVAGLVIVNNPEFGLPAAGATLVALAVARPPPSARAAARLLGEAALGLAGGIALVALFTLVRSGSLPRFGLIFEFSRLYGVGGWQMVPMPKIGLGVAMYVTCAAALVLGVVRAARREDDAPLTAMLAWSGLFGLGTSAYYAGRSHPQVLVDLFAAWGFALALLTIVVVRALAHGERRLPTAPQLAVLFGFGLMVCSLAQIPTPWSQLARIGDRTPAPVFKQAAAVRLVERTTRPHEQVEILIPLGHRIAYDAGVVNVSPYASLESMPTRDQMRTAIDALRDAGGTKVYIAEKFTFLEMAQALQRAGFRLGAVEGSFGEFVLRRGA